ncbi:TetR/AcrR family transcriptional regulator [Aestuariispira ectoiniformans]|uniref:TetR/AcrR family transcriptional regulator n=1 Tax=Aestuariispira ectoiniformans TaxID=2775080 RepID=UPI00223B67C9|nr:TetR/AcrR family transcriptional regulator [Aestuariispira ectoiniformans]
MARPKTFDPEQALDQAVELFWCKGFENTSMQDLVDRMGINRGSLYDTFGDKHALYLKALDRYINRHSIRLVAEQEAGKPARDILRSMLYRLADCTTEECPELKRGCLMTNTICELCTRDGDVATVVRDSLQRMEDAVAGIIAEGQAQGQIAPDKDSRALARFFLTTLQGMQVMRKAHTSPDVLRQIANQALSLI